MAEDDRGDETDYSADEEEATDDTDRDSEGGDHTNGPGSWSAGPPSIGSSDIVTISVATMQSRLTAMLRNPGSDCQRRYTAAVSRVGLAEWQLAPSGPAGAYDVDLFVDGQGGSAAATFRWTSTRSGTSPVRDCLS